MCIKDLMETGLVEWSEMHSDILKDEYISNMLKDANSYGGDGKLKDEVIRQYGINCVNDCSRNGACMKSKKILIECFFKFIKEGINLLKILIALWEKIVIT